MPATKSISVKSVEAEAPRLGRRFARLDSVCQIRHGGTPSKDVPEYWRGSLPWASPKDMWVDLVENTQDHISEEAVRQSATNIAGEDSLLVVIRSGILARRFPVAMAATRLAYNQDIKALLPDRAAIDPWFLFYVLRATEQEVLAHGVKKGATVHSIKSGFLEALRVPLPPLPEQRRIAAGLRDRLAEVTKASASVQVQTETLDKLIHAVLRESLRMGSPQPARLADCLHEVTDGIGEDWRSYPVLGATRGGLAPAKEGVGKNPGRYKPVRPGTIFYNPMRILLGSIAMLEEDDAPGVTSPDYVVMTAVEGRLSPRWFYHWFRSQYGAEFIKSMTRGAVRERLLFKRLAPATLLLPDWNHQQAAASQMAAIRQAKAKLADQLAALDHLPAALLRDAFSGRL